MKLAIVIATYKRSDGKSLGYVTRALESIKKQTYQDYKIFLIGDKYENPQEFNYLSSLVDAEKIMAVNLPYAVERDIYPDGESLWCAGGTHARNVGIELALSEGYEYVCHLDHDDFWKEDHLENINAVIEEKGDASFVYTCSTFLYDYLALTIPLDINPDGEVVEMPPKPMNIAHSSICINHAMIPFRYVDMNAYYGKPSPSDMNFWERINNLIQKKNLKSYLIKKVTCYHPSEREHNR